MTVHASEAFVDTNILVYALIFDDATSKKYDDANTLLKAQISISTQVINELCNNLVKAKFAESQIRAIISLLYQRCNIVPLDETLILSASKLRERHSLSFWDSLIVSAALAAKASILYSEDMQDGLMISATLRIVNPFKQPQP